MMNKMFKINGNPEQYEDLDVFHKLAQQFLPYAHKKLGFDKPVGVNLLSDPENLKDPLGKTAYYDLNKMEITLFVDKRHVKDILRSMAHELVHHAQNCRGEFDGGVKTGPGYAQDDEHMRKMEAEAYLKGSGFLLRDWEDSLKENKTMSKRKLAEQVAGEEHSKYAKGWAKRKGLKLPTGPWEKTEKRFPKSAGFRPTDENMIEEDAASLLKTAAEEGASEEDLKALRAKAGVPEPDLSQGPNLLDPSYDGPLGPSWDDKMQRARQDTNYKFIERMAAAGFTIAEISEILGIGENEVEIAAGGIDPQAIEAQFEGVNKTLEEEGLEEADVPKPLDPEEEPPKRIPTPPIKGGGKGPERPVRVNENWFKGNKDQLLFERLVEKWAK